MTSKSVLAEMRVQQQDELLGDIMHAWLHNKGSLNKSKLYENLKKEHYKRKYIGEPISSSTFYAKIKRDYNPYDIVRARQGRVAAKNLRNTKIASAEVPCFMGGCEHDVLFAPISLLDPETFRPLKLTIKEYFTIDPWTSVLLGNSTDYSGRGENSEMLIEHLKHIMLPKPSLHSQIGVTQPFFAYGTPLCLLLDNATQNKSDALKQFIFRYRIIAKYARTQSGRDKPHIESFNKTFKVSFLCALPGSYDDTLIHLDRDIVSVWRDATLTTEEYEILKWRYLNQYNYSYDKKRKFYRNEQWNAESYIQPVNLVVDVKQLLAEGGINTTKTIIKNEGFTFTLDYTRKRYNSAELQQMRSSIELIKGPKWDGKVEIRYSSLNPNFVHAINDITKEIIAVPRVEEAYYLSLFRGDNEFYQELALKESQRDLKTLSDEDIIEHAIKRKKNIVAYHKLQQREKRENAVTFDDMKEKDTQKVNDALEAANKDLDRVMPITASSHPTLPATNTDNLKEQNVSPFDWDSDSNPFE